MVDKALSWSSPAYEDDKWIVVEKDVYGDKVVYEFATFDAAYDFHIYRAIENTQTLGDDVV